MQVDVMYVVQTAPVQAEQTRPEPGEAGQQADDGWERRGKW